MEFQRVVERRHMVRSFETTPLDESVIERLVANAARAPSAGNTQGWAFLVLTDHDDRARFWKAAWPDANESDSSIQRGRHGVMTAPVLIIPCSHKQAYLDRYAEPDKRETMLSDEASWPAPYWEIDTAFATMLILLTATDEDLGAVLFRIHHVDAVKKAFDIPEAFSPIGAIAVGKAAPDRPSPSLSRGRRPLHELVHRGRW
ncbi:MAG: nitroreductase family protein [Actinomycetota bacterium]